MKKLLVAIIAVMGMTASAATLTGKIILKGNNTGSAAAQVCMKGICTPVGSDGSYSLDVSTDGIASRHSGVGASADLYRLGQFVVSASGRQVELINMKGQRIASDKGSLDISKVPGGVYMATDGKHVLRLNTMSKSGYAISGGSGTMASGVAARATDTTHLYGTAYVVVDGDTLKEIPVTSWNLPTGYMVQRNVTAFTGSMFAGDSAQFVFWSDDSVAYVVSLELDDGNSTKQYTGFVYTYYDEAAFTNNKKVFSCFVRTYKNDTMMAYSDAFSVKSKSGNFSVDSTKFHLTTYNRTGWSQVPALDTLKKWADSTKLYYNGQWISIDGILAYDSASQRYVYSSLDTTRWAQVAALSDSIEFTDSTVGQTKDTSYEYNFLLGGGSAGPILTVKSSTADSVVVNEIAMTEFGVHDGLRLNLSLDKNDTTGYYDLAYISTNATNIKPGTGFKVRFHIKN